MCFKLSQMFNATHFEVMTKIKMFAWSLVFTERDTHHTYCMKAANINKLHLKMFFFMTRNEVQENKESHFVIGIID